MKSAATTKIGVSEVPCNENNNGILKESIEINKMDNINISLKNPEYKNKNTNSYTSVRLQ